MARAKQNKKTRNIAGNIPPPFTKAASDYKMSFVI